MRTASLASTGLPGTGCLPTVKGVRSRHLGAARRKAWGWLNPELGVLHVSPWCQVHQGPGPVLGAPDPEALCLDFWEIRRGRAMPGGDVRGGAHF